MRYSLTYQIVKKSRNGKYRGYEKRILQILIKQKDDLSAGVIRRKSKIPKSSLYDVLGKLRYYGYIIWIGEPQDSISVILITEKGRDYLKNLTN